MRKLPEYYENPIDNFFFKFIPNTSELFDKFTPNFITTLSFINGLAMLYYFKNKNTTLAIINLILSFYFDMLDGYHARRKKMFSKFGDYFDHISDVIIFILFIILLKDYYNHKHFTHIIIGFIILAILMQLHLTLQEIYFGKKQTAFLNFFNINNKKYIKFLPISRFFGCGTFHLFWIIVIYYLTNK